MHESTNDDVNNDTATNTDPDTDTAERAISSDPMLQGMPVTVLRNLVGVNRLMADVAKAEVLRRASNIFQGKMETKTAAELRDAFKVVEGLSAAHFRSVVQQRRRDKFRDLVRKSDVRGDNYGWWGGEWIMKEYGHEEVPETRLLVDSWSKAFFRQVREAVEIELNRRIESGTL